AVVGRLGGQDVTTRRGVYPSEAEGTARSLTDLGRALKKLDQRDVAIGVSRVGVDRDIGSGGDRGVGTRTGDADDGRIICTGGRECRGLEGYVRISTKSLY